MRKNESGAVHEAVDAASDKRAPKFTIENLRSHCLDVFGVTLSTFNGAVYGLEGNFTVEEMRKHIEAWKSQTVVPQMKEEVN